MTNSHSAAIINCDNFPRRQLRHCDYVKLKNQMRNIENETRVSECDLSYIVMQLTIAK